jgi:predicted amidohydrolase YtcJ
VKADLLLRGGAIHPLGRFGARAVTHLAVGGERVLAAGGRELDGLRGSRTRVVDLAGRAVLPGFDDAHAHVVYFGLTSFGADLTGSRSLPELQDRIRRVHERLGPGRWLVARGYSAADLAEGRAPVREELDAVVGDRPAYADERGGHSRVASTAALAAARLGPDTADPVGGSLGRRPDGSLDGRLIESAMRLVSDHQPAPDFGERMTGILRCQRLLLARGVTAVGAAVNRGFADDLGAFRELEADGRLQLRVNEFLSWELLGAASSLGVRPGFGGRVRAGPVKVFIDGGAAAGAVALRGVPNPLWRTPPQDLKRLVARASAAGLQVAAHAVGDAAIAAFCDAVEAAGPAAVRQRHRVEHCTACPPDLQARLARLGMLAVMQPLFATLGRARAGGAFPEHLRPHLGAHRALLRAGVRLAFSSDLPVVPDPDPWAGLAAAVADPAGPLRPLQALRAYTSGGAYAAFAERERGTLEPGMLADFQVLDADPFAIRPEKWLGLRPSAVAVGGAPVLGTLLS